MRRLVSETGLHQVHQDGAAEVGDRSLLKTIVNVSISVLTWGVLPKCHSGQGLRAKPMIQDRRGSVWMSAKPAASNSSAMETSLWPWSSP